MDHVPSSYFEFPDCFRRQEMSHGNQKRGRRHGLFVCSGLLIGRWQPVAWQLKVPSESSCGIVVDEGLPSHGATPSISPIGHEVIGDWMTMKKFRIH